MQATSSSKYLLTPWNSNEVRASDEDSVVWWRRMTAFSGINGMGIQGNGVRLVAAESGFGNPGNGMPFNLRYRRLGTYQPKNESGMGVDGAASWGAKPQIHQLRK